MDRDIGNQAVGDCPFCGKEGKFYANKENKLWDCKVCGASGNFEDFLGRAAEGYAQNCTEERLAALAKGRGLPVSAFRFWKIGWNGDRYAFPVQNSKGRTVDIRMYRLGGKLMSTPEAQTGLFNLADLLDPNKLREPVYICEGEWDCVAWNWLLARLGVAGLAVGTPGASTFKNTWNQLFQDRDVVVLYDNDAAGERGELKVLERLTGTAKSVRFLHWTSSFPDGYDVRDLVKSVAVHQKNPKKAWESVRILLRDRPRLSPSDSAGQLPQRVPGAMERAGTSAGGGDAVPQGLEPITRTELLRAYKKWLHLANEAPLIVMYGALMANMLDGDPVWLFLVAPPGGSKSELLMSLALGRGIHCMSSLTPHTLVSGATWGGGQDPSLLPQLNGKVLIIKDFTTILTMHYTVRDEIFGTLRDIYDGSYEKPFGNGVRRKYNSKFGIIAGVTPIIETFNVMHQSLGERFLKFRISGNWDSISEEEKILRALTNIGKEDAMRRELQVAGARWLAHCRPPEKLPTISGEYLRRLVHLAKFASRLRGVVDRNKFTDEVLYKPSSEVGTRIAKQLAKLGTGICMFLEKEEFDEDVYALVRRVALDTVPDRVEDIVRSLHLAGQRGGKAGEVALATRLPASTVGRVLQDMGLLKLTEVAHSKDGVRHRLSDKLAEHIKTAQIYEEVALAEPRTRMKIGRKAA